MLSIKPLPEFTAWLDGLADTTVRSVVVARIRRIHLGAGWRVYFTRRGTQLVVLLAGGSKRTQTRDIKRAQALAALLDTSEE